MMIKRWVLPIMEQRERNMVIGIQVRTLWHSPWVLKKLMRVKWGMA